MDTIERLKERVAAEVDARQEQLIQIADTIHANPELGFEEFKAVSLLAGAPKTLQGSTSIRLHLYSGEVLGRLRPLQGPLAPGATGAVEIRLSQPIVAVRGDRFIVRRPSPPTTLGGGEILDPFCTVFHWAGNLYRSGFK